MHHTALQAAAPAPNTTDTTNTTAREPRRAALPGASSSGRGGGAAGREERQCHPANARCAPRLCPPPWTPSSAKPPGPRLGRRGSPAPRAGAGGPRGTSQEPHDFKTPDLTSTDHVGHPLALGPDLSQASKAHTRMQLPQERKAALLRGQGEVHGPGDTPRSKLARSGRVGTCPYWPPLCPQGLRKREYRTDLLPFSVLRELTCRLPRTLLGAQKVLPNTH